MAYTTRVSLLSKIGKGDEIGWFDFHKTYRALILLRGGDHGLSISEKEELVQEVLISIFKNGKLVYDSQKGKFRNFMRTIIDRRSVDILRKRRPDIISVDKDELEQFSDFDQSDFDQYWDTEWREHILTQAVTELRQRIAPITFQAFELYILKEWEPAKVADFLDISVNSVYVAKNRAVEQLRKIVKEQEAI